MSGWRGLVRRTLLPALASIAAVVVLIAVLQGIAPSGLLRTLQAIAIGVLAVALLMGLIALAITRMSDWSDPADEDEFEAIVQRSERLAHENLAAEPGEGEFLAVDYDDDDAFAELIREALDELPDLLRASLDRVAVIVSDRGRREGAYGQYQGGSIARDDQPHRIVIFRDTLVRDFGQDPDALREQVTRTVRHELAHHLGADELGVRELGL